VEQASSIVDDVNQAHSSSYSHSDPQQLDLKHS
jgi:hypothetical protein